MSKLKIYPLKILYSFFSISIVFIIHFCATIQNSHVRAGSVYAIVNDQVISHYDVQQRMLIMSIGNTLVSEKVIRKTAQDELISDIIKITDAKKHGFVVSELHLNDAIDTVAKRSNVSTKVFVQALINSGIDVRSLKKRLESQIVWTQYMSEKYAHLVSTNDIKAKDNVNTTSKKTQTIYKFRQLVFLLSESVSKKNKKKIYTSAQNLAKKTIQCNDLDTHIHSSDAVNITHTISAKKEEIDTKMLNLLNSIKPHQFTRPVEIEKGYAFVLLCAKEKVNVQAKITKYEISVLNTKLERLAKRYYNKLRKTAVIEFRNGT